MKASRGLLLVGLLLASGLAAPPPAEAQSGSADPLADAPWSEMPLAPIGVPADQGGSEYGRHFRVQLRVDPPAGMGPVFDFPVAATVDLRQALIDGGFPSEGGELIGFTLDSNSTSLWEVNAAGQTLGRVAAEFFLGGFESTIPYHPRTNPVVTARWVLSGSTTGTRHFFLYFDGVHNPLKPRTTLSSQDQAPLASSVGPVIGNQLYVPLYPMAGKQAGNEPRSVRVTRILAGVANVDIYEYTRFGLPSAVPVAQLRLDDTNPQRVYRFGNNGNLPSEGTLLLVADRPIMAEASSGTMPPPGGRFLPSGRGGYLNTEFLDVPTAALDWIVYCPNGLQPAGTTGCSVRFQQGGAEQGYDVGLGYHARVPVAAGSPARLLADTGRVAVQRAGAASLVLWPPLDGPASASVFMGEAASSDRLLMTSHSANARVRIQSLGGSNPILMNATVAPGLMSDSPGWGVGWNRYWPTGKAHVSGPAALRTLASPPQSPEPGRLSVLSGPVSGTSQFTALVGLQSATGGLSYDFVVPEDSSGTAIGRLLLFSPYEGARVTATRVRGSLSETQEHGPLQRHERVALDGAGQWRVQADRPVVVAWLKTGLDQFTGPALAVTTLAQVTVGAAQIRGHLLALTANPAVTLAEPGEPVEYRLDVDNLGRRIDGTLVADEARLSFRLPTGWTSAQIVPPTLQLGPGGHDTAQFSLVVPKGVDTSTGGATVTVIVASAGNPRLVQELPLRVNFRLVRAVELTADGQDLEARRAIAANETASYLVRVLNRGSVVDSFDLTYSDPSFPWNMTLKAVAGPDVNRTPPLGPGQSQLLQVDLRPEPGSGLPGRLITHILATSVSDRSVNDAVRLSTSMAVNRSFTLHATDPIRTIGPGRSSTFDLIVKNNADVNEELKVIIGGVVPAGWAAPSVEWVGVGRLEDVNYVVALKERSEIVLRVTRPVPSSAQPFDLAVDRLRFESRLDSAADAAEIELRVVVDRILGLDAGLLPLTQSAAPGQTIPFTLTLRSGANVPQTAEVRPQAPSEPADWTFVTKDERAPPWQATLSPNATSQLEVLLRVPDRAPPTADSPHRIVFTVTVPGLPVRNITAQVLVAQQPRALVEEGQARLAPGRSTVVPVRVTNQGNVPLSLVGTFEGLPAGWQSAPANLTLPVGGEAILEMTVTLPPDPATLEGPARFLLKSPGDGRLLAEVPWTLLIGRPELDVQFERGASLPGVAASYVVRVRNQGSAPAYDVDVSLVRDSLVVDRIRVQEILPDATHVVTLTSPSAGGSLAIRVEAAHESAGLLLSISEPEEEGGGVPGPASWLALAALAVALAGRRRWAS